MTEENRDLDFATLAIAHKILTHEQVEDAQEIIKIEKKAGKMERSLETVLREMGIIKEEEIWAVYKAKERLRRDATNVGEKIGGYEIIDKVGEGGLGVVYKARQLSMGRIVALKVLHEKWLADDEFRKRFLVEARLVGRLSHPNLIQVIDVGRHRNQLYYSMEFVNGMPVEDTLNEDGSLPIAEAIDIVMQVASALDYLASKKIVHRDVKPGNIMLTKKGIAKLGDFGFVKSSLDSVLSPDGEILGTPDYISPEAACGDRDIDPRSDMYSLGVTLYHMICGEPPFSGSSNDVLDSHIFRNAPDIQEKAPHAPAALCKVIKKMIAKKPEDRYSDFRVLISELDRIKHNVDPEYTSGDTAITNTSSIDYKTERKLKIVTIALVINLALLIAAVLFILYLLNF